MPLIRTATTEPNPSPEAVRLLDDFVHDSRAGFRTPRFHELAPGGYGMPRVIYAGSDKAYFGA